MTDLSERYRRNAEKCLQLAQNFNDLEAKRSLLVMANAWLALAAQREKNANPMLGRELPPEKPPKPPDDPPKPIPGDDPPEPPIREPPPVNEPPPQRLQSAKSDDPMQS